MRFIDDVPLIYNLNNVDTSKTIYVTEEGAIDSLFLPNSIAVGGSDFKKIDSRLKENAILVYDNEPRNLEIIKKIDGVIDDGWKVCIWNDKRITEFKDINDMIMGGLSQNEIVEIINSCTLCRSLSKTKTNGVQENMSNSDIKVVKSDGSKVSIDLDKIHKMVEKACRGITGVSESLVEMNSGLQFYDGITTKEIQKILVKSASDLISLESPNYQFVARLLLFAIQKQVFNTKWKDSEIYPPLKELVERNIEHGVYDEDILNYYSDQEFESLDKYIKHGRDLDYTYAGLQQVVDKYLVQDRSTGNVYETPQFMYMLIAMTLFREYKENRLEYVKRYYDAISTFKINIPTPIMAGVRTPLRQFASCVLVDSDDTLGSIFSSDMAIGRYVAQRAGIGINAGRIRGLGARIRGGEVQHTGVIPFLKKFESTVRCCTQNGVRGGSATVHFPIWHQEIEDIIVLKNNKGTEDNRVRKLDYSIQLSKLFYERFLSNGEITLFSPHDVPGLYDAFGTEEFDEL